MVNSKKQIQFGEIKYQSLPQECLNCKVNFICNGGCPKNRIIKTEDGEEGLNYLCSGYKQFFKYIDPYMKEVILRLKKRQSPPTIQKELRGIQRNIWKAERNDLCPCGSGKKYKKCCVDRI